MLAFAYLQTDCNSTEHVALYPLMDSAEITRTSSRYGGMSRRISAPWNFNAKRMTLVLRAGQRQNCRHASWNNTMSPTGQLPYCHALINPRVSFDFFAYGRQLMKLRGFCLRESRPSLNEVFVFGISMHQQHISCYLQRFEFKLFWVC